MFGQLFVYYYDIFVEQVQKMMQQRRILLNYQYHYGQIMGAIDDEFDLHYFHHAFKEKETSLNILIYLF
jgi:hypothetical protein